MILIFVERNFLLPASFLCCNMTLDNTRRKQGDTIMHSQQVRKYFIFPSPPPISNVGAYTSKAMHMESNVVLAGMDVPVVNADDLQTAKVECEFIIC